MPNQKETPVEQAENYVDELADIGQFLDENEIPRFDTTTGEALRLRQRVEIYGKKVTAELMIEGLKKSLEERANRRNNPFGGLFGDSPFGR